MRYLLPLLFLLAGCGTSHHQAPPPTPLADRNEATLMWGSGQLSNEKNMTVYLTGDSLYFTLQSGAVLYFATYPGTMGPWEVSLVNRVLHLTNKDDGSEGVWVIGAVAN